MCTTGKNDKCQADKRIVVTAHVCGTEMMFFELPKGRDRYFYTRDNVPDQGKCDLKSNPFTFWYFSKKMCKKHPK